KSLPALRAERDFQPHFSFQCRHEQFAAEHRAPRVDLDIMTQIAALDREIGMLGQPHAQKWIAAFSSADARLALPGQTDSLPFVDAARNLDLIVFHLVRPGAAQRNRPGRTVESFFQRDHDVGFHVGPAFGCRLTPAESTESRSAAPAAEKRFEEIAESSSAKFELDPAVTAPLVKSAFGGVCPPSRRRLKSARPVPIGPELIVLLPLFRVAQYLVGFVDLLKFLFRRLFVLGDIGMMFPRQLAKCGANFILGGRFRDTECFVIVSKLNWHRLSNLVPLFNPRNFLTRYARTWQVCSRHRYRHHARGSGDVERICSEMAGPFAG